ncbi:hypothetical protein [Cupriavidus sp. PET2-C1]
MSLTLLVGLRGGGITGNKLHVLTLFLPDERGMLDPGPAANQLP